MNKLCMAFALAMCWGSMAFASEPVRILVDFRDDASMREVGAAEKLIGASLQPASDIMWEADKLMVVDVPEDKAAEDLKLLNSDSDVEVAELDQVYEADGGADFSVPNDKYYPKQKWNFDMIGLEKAWKLSTGEGVVVAVLDTGVSDGRDPSHPRVGDLAETKILPGYNFVNNNDNPYDAHGHGTHCASTIAESTNNTIGGAGIAFRSKILPVKVLSDSGSGSTEGIAEGIKWATDHGANIISMSLGGGSRSEIMEKAVQYAVKHGVMIFAAAGNDPGERVHYPSAYDGVFAISAVGPGGEVGTPNASNPKTAQLATYSSYGGAGGKKGIFLAAPGGDKQRFGIDGTVWQSTVAEGNPTAWAMRGFQGTSMATPHVSGVAALVISKLMEKNDGKYSTKDVEKIMIKSAVDRGDKTRYGNGILNADSAVEMSAENTHTTAFAITGAVGVVLAVVWFRRRK